MAGVGFAQNFGAGPTAFELSVRIPLCLLWQLMDGKSDAAGVGVFGMGPTQAALVSMVFRRLNVASAMPAGFSLSGALSIDVGPDQHPSRYNRACIIPRWHQFSESDRTAEFPGLAGLPLAIVERSALHAASVLSDCGLRIDDLELFDKVSVQKGTAYTDELPHLPAEADIRDRETVLYVIPPNARLENIPRGRRASSSTAHAAHRGAGPLLRGAAHPGPRGGRGEGARAPAGRTINAVSLATVLGLNVPSNVVPFLGWALFTDDAAEFEKWPGAALRPRGEGSARGLLPRQRGRPRAPARGLARLGG